VSGGPRPESRPSLFDAAFFPDVLPSAVAAEAALAAARPDAAARDAAPPGAAEDGPGGATPGAVGAPRWGRAVGAFLFWNLAQSLFLLPRLAPGVVPAAGAPAAWYRPLIAPPAGAALNVLVAAGFLWWFALRPAARADARRRATFRVRPLARAAWPWAAAASLAAALAVNAALLVLPRFTRVPREEPFLEVYMRLPGGALAVAALAVLVAPLLEEFFFRGWAQGALERRLPPWPAVLVTAATFAALHGVEPFGLLPRLALATAAGYAAWATRSIWPSVALHATYNASLFAGGGVLPALLPRPPRAEAWADADRAMFFFWANDPRVFWPALVVLLAAAAAAVYALRRLAAAARAGGAPA
jgi:membrane protease YdiL (CAAX protease family)